MHDTDPVVEIVDVDIRAWVESASADPPLYRDRQVTEIVLTAIGLSHLVTLLNNLAVAKSASSGAFVTIGLIPAAIGASVAGALWYFASIRKSIIALVLIGGVVASKAITYYRLLPEAVWSNQTWLLMNIGPLLLLVVGIGAMMTPTAKSWRSARYQRLSNVFE